MGFGIFNFNVDRMKPKIENIGRVLLFFAQNQEKFESSNDFRFLPTHMNMTDDYLHYGCLPDDSGKNKLSVVKVMNRKIAANPKKIIVNV